MTAQPTHRLPHQVHERLRRQHDLRFGKPGDLARFAAGGLGRPASSGPKRCRRPGPKPALKGTAPALAVVRQSAVAPPTASQRQEARMALELDSYALGAVDAATLELFKPQPKHTKAEHAEKVLAAMRLAGVTEVPSVSVRSRWSMRWLIDDLPDHVRQYLEAAHPHTSLCPSATCKRTQAREMQWHRWPAHLKLFMKHVVLSEADTELLSRAWGPSSRAVQALQVLRYTHRNHRRTLSKQVTRCLQA